MAVYWIRAGQLPLIKIGWTIDTAERRRDELQAGSWEELHIVRVIEGNRLVEAWLHRQFRKHHVRGDWFNLVPEMLTIEVPDNIEGTKHPHATVIAAFGSYQALAKCIGVAPSLALHWHKRGIPAKYWVPVQEAASPLAISITAGDLMRLADPTLKPAA